MEESSPTEELPGLHTLEGHDGFARQSREVRRDLVEFLSTRRAKGASVAGYGAPGKGNTLLNHCGIRSDLLAFTVDRNPFKHGMFLPGTHIPIYHAGPLAEIRPDYVLILPWNLRTRSASSWITCATGAARLVVPHPRLEVF